MRALPIVLAWLASAGFLWGESAAPGAALAAGPAAARGEAKLEITRSAVCTAVRDREPVDGLPADPLPAFKSDIGRIIYWTEVRAKSPPSSVRHVWYNGDKKIGEVRLAVAGGRARTWSSQRVWTGDWRVEAVSPEGETLGAVRFKVGGKP